MENNEKRYPVTFSPGDVGLAVQQFVVAANLGVSLEGAFVKIQNDMDTQMSEKCGKTCPPLQFHMENPVVTDDVFEMPFVFGDDSFVLMVRKNQMNSVKRSLM